MQLRWHMRARMYVGEFFLVMEWRPLPHAPRDGGGGSRRGGFGGWMPLGSATFDVRRQPCSWEHYRTPVQQLLCRVLPKLRRQQLSEKGALVVSAAGHPFHWEPRPGHAGLGRCEEGDNSRYFTTSTVGDAVRHRKQISERTSNDDRPRPCRLLLLQRS